MRLGVFTALFGDLTSEEEVDKAASAGVSAVEIGTGGGRAALTVR